MGAFDYFDHQKNLMKKNSTYLKKGKYVLHDNLHTYMHTQASEGIVVFPKGRKGKKNFVRKILGKVLYSVRVPKNGEKFCADAVYFATVPNPEYKDMKLFDFSSQGKRVLTLCANRKRYDLYIKNRNRVEDKFPLPRLLSNDAEGLSYTEELVSGISWQGEGETEKKVYGALFRFFNSYYEKTEIRAFLPADSDNQNLPEGLIITENFGTALHHGDLSADNFKFSKEGGLYFFDFDHANTFPLYYDIFFLIFNEAVINGNLFGYELLKNGEFDKYFKNNDEKNKYLKAFFHRFYLVRLNGIASEEHKKKYLNYYKNLTEN